MAKRIKDGEEELKELVKMINSVAAVHTASEFPLILGTTEQARDLLGIVGDWNSYKSGNITGMIYDDMKSYFIEGEPGNILTGKECEDRTPVGKVAQTAPLDITSWLYWTPLVVQGIEQTYEATKPAEVDDNFMREISIADTMGAVAAYEKDHAENEGKSPHNFQVHYKDKDGNTVASLIANQPLAISGWPNILKDGYNTRGRKKSGSKSRGRTRSSGQGSTTIENNIEVNGSNAYATAARNISFPFYANSGKKESKKDIEKKVKQYVS